MALSDYTGTADFHFLPAASAYSSLLTRPEVETGQEVRYLRVAVRQLDDIVPVDVPVAFVKVDVEGGEAAVFRGAARILARDAPVIVFESDPAKLPECIPALADAGLHLWLLADFVAGRRRPLAEVLELGREDHEFCYAAARELG